MARLIISRDIVNRRRKDPLALKSVCCNYATNLSHMSITSKRTAMVLTCLKCDDLWVYYDSD